LIIVGSRCGGYDFYAQGLHGPRFWLGAETDSDLDIFCDEKPLASNYRIEWHNTQDYFVKRLINGLSIRGGIARPYFMNGTLHMPTDFVFLSIALRKKLRRSGLLQKKFLKQVYQITRPDNTFCCEIKLSFII